MNQDEIAKFKKDLRLYVDEPPFAPLKRKRSRSNGEGSIRKRGKRFEGRVTVGFDHEGKQIRKTVYAATRKECVEKIHDLLSEVKSGAIVVGETPTVMQLVMTWLNEYRKDLAASTRKRFLGLIAKLEALPLAEKKITDVIPLELQQYVNSFNSYEMAKRTIGMLNESMQFAVDNGYLQRNIAAMLKNPYPPPTPKYEDSDKSFTLDEEARFVQAIEKSPYRLMYLISLYAGLRRGEVCALTWDQINLDMRLIQVKEGATRSDTKGYVSGKTKTKHSVRKVPVCKQLYDVLAPLRQDGGFVCSSNGKMLNPDVLDTDFGNLMNKLDINHTFHHLRHTFSTRCKDKGIDIKVVQMWLGHAKADITLNVYTHATAESIDAGLKKLDE